MGLLQFTRMVIDVIGWFITLFARCRHDWHESPVCGEWDGGTGLVRMRLRRWCVKCRVSEYLWRDDP